MAERVIFMLKNYFKDPRRLKRFQTGLLALHYDDFAQSFYSQGYSKETVRSYLRTAYHYANYGIWSGKTEISQLSYDFANEFLNEHLPNCSCERMNCGKYAQATAGIEHLMKFLVNKNLVAPPENAAPAYDAMSYVLKKYDEYLESLLGLCKKTRNIHRKKATVFMEWLKSTKGKLDLSAINKGDILDFQIAIDKNSYSLNYKKTITNCLRGFLRFLRWERILETDLTPAIFTVIEWSLSTIPKYMPFDDVKLLLQAPDRSTSIGKRDLAMIILMAYLGLRSIEVVQLKISDIDFLEGYIFIRKTKTAKEHQIPITVEIAGILIDYIKNGRNNSCYDELFLRTYAPHTPIESSSAVGTVVRKYITETGIPSPTFGTHQLRHSLATHLINNGVSIKEIADLLGHLNIESTGIYAKVQFERLKAVPLPFPKSVCRGGVSI